jgi:aryl-alcohol dehydrogenase-like predicted oxidoreductase
MDTTLDTTQLGNTGLEITRIGFGAWAIGGGDWEFGWGDQDDQDSVTAIEHAIGLGINWIDTAHTYGFGRSEAVVGRAIAGLPADQRPFVFTKCSMVPSDDGHTPMHSLKRDSIRREIEGSLERLGVDAVDLYQIHWPEPEPDIEEGWQTLVELKDEGLVRHIGVSNFNVAQLERAAAIAPVETLQPPYALIERDVEQQILPYCEENGIGVIVYSPMGSGLLTGSMTRERVENFPDNDHRKREPQFQEPKLSENLKLVEQLTAVGGRHGVSAGVVAVAWTLENPAVDAAIVGFRRPDQVDPLIPASGLRLTAAEIAEIDAR